MIFGLDIGAVDKSNPYFVTGFFCQNFSVQNREVRFFKEKSLSFLGKLKN